MPNADQDRPIALIVEDDADALETRRKLFAAHGFQPIGATSEQDAIRQFRSTPTIDIVVTDINLRNDDPSNRAGVTVATEIRNQRQALPVMGLSACFRDRDLPDSDRSMFNEWLPKGKFRVDALEKKLGRWRESALKYRRERAAAAKRELDKMRRSGRLPATPQVEMMRGFLPGTHALHADDEYVTPDEMLRSEGWRLHLVEAGFSCRDDQDAEDSVVRTVSVVPLWIRQRGSTTTALLHGHPCVCSEAPLEEDAIEGALSLMYGHHRQFSEASDEPPSREMRALRDYLRGVFAEES